MVGLAKVMRHIEPKKLKFGVGFLYKALDEQRASLVEINAVVGIVPAPS